MQNVKLKELKKKKVAVLMGGKSAEREISLRTGKQVVGALRELGLNVFPIDVDEDIVQNLKSFKIDLVFIALHGRWGEDGIVQDILELMGIPYTGSGILASALAVNKVVSRELFSYHNLPVPRFQVLEKRRPRKIPGGSIRGRPQRVEIPLPLVVKPAQEGSTIGLSVVRRKEDLSSAVEDAFSYDDQILIEEFISGIEVTVTILGQEALPVIEIIPKLGHYSFQAKYTPGMTDFVIPARLPKRVYNEVQTLALKAHQILGCRDISRIDLIVDQKFRPYILEVNTIPGLTSTSLAPQAAKAVGIDYSKLVRKLLEFALVRDRPI
jgi:D-alanine-D-alanine ligase